MNWVILTVGSLLVAYLAQLAHIPASWLIAPLLVAMAMAVGGFRAKIPRQAFTIGQAIIAITLSQTITPPILAEIAQQWLPIVTVVGMSVIAAGTSGWLLARYSPIAPQTAAWGSTPGGATTMTILSADFGADPRIVAFMQYLRVTLVVLTASSVARLLGVASGTHAVTSAGPFEPLPFLQTIAFALIAGVIGRYSRVPGGQFLVPLIVAGVFHALGIIHPYVPPFLLDAAYLTIGWSIGLLYTRELLRFAISVLPALACSTLVLIALCGVCGLVLVVWIHADPLTAYLATTPGGLDTVPVIGLDSGGNLPLILAVQTMRVFAVVATGPPLAKLITRLSSAPSAQSSPRA